MPGSFARRAVAAFFRERAAEPPVARSSADAVTFCDRIALTFDVSAEAARVRLSQLGFLAD
jgi:hypothetical protein